MGSRPDRQMLKDLAALGLESGGVTLLPFFIHVSSIKNLNIEYQAKLRGVRLGSPKCYLTDEDRKVGSKIGAEVRTKNAVAKASDLMEIVEDINLSGITTLKGLARELTKRGVPTPRGKDTWYPQTVKRLYERIS